MRSLIIFLFLSSTLSAQVYLFPHVYTSLNEALQEPDSVLVLDLSQQNLVVFPEDIFKLHHLQELILNNNFLTSIPDSIGQLKELREIFLDGNKLTSLPESTGDLSKLNTLMVSSNQLTSLPASLSKLDSMSYFFIDHNPLKQWPAQVGSMDFVFGDTTFSSDHHSFAYLGHAMGMYLAEDSFYRTKEVIIFNDWNNDRELVRSTESMIDSREMLYNFEYLKFSPDGKYIYFVCGDVWEKCDALHRVNIKNGKESFVTDMIGDYMFGHNGIFVRRYYYQGEGTGSAEYLVSMNGKKKHMMTK